MAATAIDVKDVPTAEECLSLVRRIAASTQLRRANRLQELLHYLAKRALQDRCESVHEQTVGIDVFGRPEGYDTGADNIVRTSISELRKRIDAYFAGDGANEPLVMEIPRWNYVPAFRYRPITLPPAAFATAATETTVVSAAEIAPLITETSSSPAARMPLAVCGILILILAGFCGYFWLQYRNLNHSLYPWKYEPTVSQLWSQILGTGSDTDVVLADASFGLVQDLSKRTFPLDDYLNHSYMNGLEGHNSDLSRIVRWNLGSQDEFKLAHRILELDPLDKRFRLYYARDYMPDLTNRDNVILIGGSISNPWDALFESRMNFTVKFDHDGSITVANRVPARGEPAVYAQSNSVQYCVVGFLPNPSHHGQVLLIEGTGAEATEAAGNFLLSEDQLAGLKEKLHVSQLPYFEVLLKVSSVQGTPLTSSIEAYRAYPDMH